MKVSGLHIRLMAIVLTAIYLFGLFKPLVPIIHYTVNYGLYANELCENKDKPELHCNGTCALAKKLQLDNEVSDKPALPHFESLDWYIGLLNEDPNYGLEPALRQNFVAKNMELGSSIFLESPTPPPIIAA